MPRWKNKVNCHNPADRAEAPATALGEPMRVSRRTDKRPNQNHQRRRAKATTWDAAKCQRRAETACNSVPTSTSQFAKNVVVIPSKARDLGSCVNHETDLN